MNQPFQAVYEGGVLRPLEPLDLKERQVVSLTVVNVADAQAGDDVLARQQVALRELDEATRELPVVNPNDGFSSSDHDQILYGWKK